MAGLKKALSKRLPKFVAIVGGSGAGKTWLARQLRARLGHVACHISLDDFYRDRSHLPPAARRFVNFDNPRAIDWQSLEKVVRDCLSRRTTVLPQYDFANHTRKPHAIPFTPRPLVIIDGLWLLRRRSLRRLFACRVFLQCPQRLRLSRRLQRDRSERGRSSEMICRQFQQTVAPMHNRFVEPQSRWADIVFKHPPTPRDVTLLAKRLRALVKPHTV